MTTLNRLAATIAQRRDASAESSWTARLLAGGPIKTSKKFGEEAIEAVLAASCGERDELIHEAADVLYHLLVMLESRGVSLGAVYAELERREARSGIEEKAGREG